MVKMSKVISVMGFRLLRKVLNKNTMEELPENMLSTLFILLRRSTCKPCYAV